MSQRTVCDMCEGALLLPAFKFDLCVVQKVRTSAGGTYLENRVVLDICQLCSKRLPVTLLTKLPSVNEYPETSESSG